MIGRLTGKVIDHGHGATDGSVVLDVGGVGYEVFVPLRTLSRLPLEEPVTLHVHTHVREDALVLYGFASADDRATFRVLLGISNVGPKLAMAVMSDLGAAELHRVIALGDRARLEAVSGVGKKTAARLLLELKDKLPMPIDLHGATATADKPARPPSGDVASQVCDTLVGLGFTRAQAEAAVAKVSKPEQKVPVEQMLRLALGT
ncbi:MAG TPA: Holliday junction branch migration protein RuvA, partial [Polyangiales bacterium]|nr:Holliday junction branch migration protein RuvA [Polyangiales bacterium]